MRKRYGLLATVAFLLLCSGPARADFYVIGVPAGVGTRINSLPYTITQPGFYYLASNLTGPPGQHGITVSADNVTIDLMGFSITGPGTTGPERGISMTGKTNVEIRNGTIRNFHYGILEAGATGKNHRVLHIRAEGNSCGIQLYGPGHLVENCTASDNIGLGIYISPQLGGSVVKGNVVRNSGAGISAWNSLVIYNVATGNATYNLSTTSCTLVGNHAAP
jgi:parallel beta-helix repeat protein